ncbi:uncharacterized protein LOC114526490 [Dendronephthya gigantea]|uniref:uncharacterized protein LOC114526490 n=1 Tax=Dendronephthya gigantea TaxID=151771 RepID=UPI00106AFA5D|nr:uncharacterized protein LOC114526490 [Dendronephthya gigantea]
MSHFQTFNFVTILISTTRIRTTVSHKTNEVIWPEGTFGLPRPKSGCPATDQFVWDQGWRLQNMEKKSEFSKSFHMLAALSPSLLSRAFCIKRQDGKILTTKKWPKGSYCIYQYGGTCPSGMVNGYIKWDDKSESEGNLNQNLGSLPEGKYDDNTKIFYCCQNQSSWHDVIELPNTSPFYLLPYKSRLQNFKECQRVKWAHATLEYITYDTENNNNQDEFVGHHILTDELRGMPKVYYCYYESCRYKRLNETRGNFNSSVFPSYQSCSWLLTVEESFVVSLNLTSLYITDCKENLLTIYDGASDATPVIETHCGLTTPKDVEVVSSGKNIYIVLQSGNLSAHTGNYSFGFKAQYGPQKVFQTPRRTPHNVQAIALTFSFLLLILIGVAVAIGYRRSKIETRSKMPKSRFHVPSTISLEMTGTVEPPERVSSCKETRNPYYVTAKLWDDSSLSRSSDNVAYVTSPELNHGYMDAPGVDHTT